MSEKKENSRGGLRVPVQSIIGEYSYKGTVDKCEIVDVSFTGIGIKVTHIIAESDILDIRFDLEKNVRIYCKGKVVSVRGGRVGIHFLEISEKAKKSIAKYIENYTNTKISNILKGSSSIEKF